MLLVQTYSYKTYMMKRTLKIWSIRIFCVGIISFLTIILTMFNPSFLYANQTEIGNYIVYHQTEVAPELADRLQAAQSLIQKSELYDPNFKIKVCLNDGSYYPALMETLRGPAFAWGFYDITTFRGNADYENNRIELNGYQWNLEQLFAHEFVHCLQSNALGLLRANPIGNYPEWKWEGYPEYIARQNEGQRSLLNNINRLSAAKEAVPDAWRITFEDNTIVSRRYYTYWLLVQYCMNIKGMSYLELLHDTRSKAVWEKKMEEWYLASY